MYDSLAELSSAFGVAGHEGEIRDAILNLGDFPDHSVDKMGNLICHGPQKEGAPTVLLDAHMDEVGFIVKFIDDDGMIYIEPLGGIDPRALIGKRFLIKGKDQLEGVVGDIPPHLSKDGKAPDLSELAVDTGLSGKELEAIIDVGDPVGYISPLRRMGGSKVSGKSLDNRVGCLTLCELSKNVGADCNIIYLFSTQEEVGTRGATMALRKMAPDIAICVDATQGDMHFKKSPILRELGGGTIIGAGPNIDPNVFKTLSQTADKCNIRHTTKAYPRPTPTNLRSIQLIGGGVPSGLLAIPCRYMHAPNEVVDINDIISTVSLLEAFLDDIDNVIEGGP